MEAAERITSYNRLKQKIEDTPLKEEFKNKKEILLKMAAVCTGICESPEACNHTCPLHCEDAKEEVKK